MNRFPQDLLETLIAVAEQRNFLEAARSLDCSQAGVSLKLRKLESLAPAPIFRLHGKKKLLTDYGRELYRTAKAAFARTDQTIETLNRKYLSPEQLTLRVGGRQEALASALPALLQFAGRTEFYPLSSRDAVAKLQHHEIDIAISYERQDSTDIMSKKILESRAYLIAHKRWTKGGALPLALTKNHDFLTQTPCFLYTQGGHLMAEWGRAHSVKLDQLRVKAIAQDWTMIANMVTRGAGYAVVPQYAVPNDKDVRACLLPESVLPKYVFYASFHRYLREITGFKSLLQKLG